MYFLIESIFVGIYTSFIYLLFSPFITNFYFCLLFCGFFKHFLGSSLGLWTWYCNNGNACVKILSSNQYYEGNTKYIIRDSFYEAIVFLIIGSILKIFIINNIFLYFILGIVLHIGSEIIGLHNSFCRKSCDKKRKINQ
jgi:hypothetical protein